MGRDWALGVAWIKRFGGVEEGFWARPRHSLGGGRGAIGAGWNGAARVALCWQELDNARKVLETPVYQVFSKVLSKVTKF